MAPNNTSIASDSAGLVSNISSMGLEDVATIAAIISPFLILLTHKWNTIDSVQDREKILRNRVEEIKTTAGGWTMQVTAIRTKENDSFRSKLRKLFLFQIRGYTRLEIFILKKKIPQAELWENPLFEVFCEEQDFDVEYVSTNVEDTDSTGVIFRVNSLDPQIIEDFAKVLPEYLRLLSKKGWLNPVGPQTELDQLEDADFSEETLSNLRNSSD